MSSIDSAEDLVPWYRAQLDEDERIALAAPRHDWTILLAGDVESGERTEQRVLDHVMQHDPGRILAEVEAKRRILAEHQIYDLGVQPCCATCGSDDQAGGLTGEWPCLTLRLLALPIAGQLGYREEWRP